MTTKSKASSSKKAARKKASARVSPSSQSRKKQTISPKERWLLISESAYARAQKRGFIGGNPFEEWVEAEREVDAKYATDFRAAFALTDATEMMEQFKGVFAGYGFGHLGLDALLDKNRGGLEKLAALNRKLVSGTSELANQQTALFQDAVSEAVKTLQSFARGKVNTEGVAKQAELSTQAIENVLSHVKDFTESMAEISPAPKKAAPRRTKRPPTS